MSATNPYKPDKSPDHVGVFLFAFAMAKLSGLVPFTHPYDAPVPPGHNRHTSCLSRIGDAWAMWKDGWLPWCIGWGKTAPALYITPTPTPPPAQ